MSALFGVSALYHRGNWTTAWRQRLQRLDHLMIFFLIAGTATPAFLIAMPGPLGLTGLIVVWMLAATAGTVHMAWMNAPELIVGGTFVGLGWMAGAGVPSVWIHAGPTPGVLVLGGGLLYTAGRCATGAGGPTPTRRCSATTRSFTLTSAPLPGASTPPWRCCSAEPARNTDNGNRVQHYGRLQALGQEEAAVKARNSVRSLKNKPGSVVVRRRGRVFVINRANPRWKARQG